MADIEAAADPLGIATLIAGAFARDLHLLYRYGIDVQRQTEDLDLAFALSDWAAFDALTERLTGSGAFRHRRTLHIGCGIAPACSSISCRSERWRPRRGRLRGHPVAK
ncbi:MAG: hypothetical protein WC830_06110 [Burkholderiales bacterium]